MTVLELLTAALRRCGVLATGETPSSEEENESLQTLNLMLGNWNAEGLNINSITRENFTLTAAKTSYTWGTGGDFNSARPLKVLGAFIRENGVDTPVDLLSATEYREIASKSTSSNIPEYAYYNPTYPTGTIYVYPVPTTNADIHIDSEKNLTEYTSTGDTISLPTEYLLPIRENLAVLIADEYGIQVSQPLFISAQNTKANLQRLNAANLVEVLDTDIMTGGRRYDIYSDS